MNIEKLIEDFVNLKIDLIDYLLKLEHLEVSKFYYKLQRNN